MVKPAYIGSVMATIELQEIRHPKIRAIMQLLFESYRKGEKIDDQSLMNLLPDQEMIMIVDVHRHMVVHGTVQGDYIRGAQKSFSMMYRKVYNVEMSDREFTEKVVRPLTDPNADNIIAEMDGDRTLVSANSSELSEFGYRGQLPALLLHI
jgi:hypothetical protein